MQQRTIGIMGAMPEEINSLVGLMENKVEHSIGMRTYTIGEINGIKTVIVFSRWGKVAAATTVSTLILKFHVTEIIFTGVAGAINNELQIGDVVLAKRLVQHDMDARPLMPRFEIPLLQKTFFECNDEQLNIASTAINQLLDNKQLHATIGNEQLKQFNIQQPKLVIGDIASGDQFFSSSTDKNKLLESLPSVLCVEMEGAAVAQVCYEYNVPFTIIRTISDIADEHAPIDFPSFINNISSKYSLEIVINIYEQFTD
jgi:adenosylhomocysteine nucleosidase